jgi:tyrosine decarboxylase / aspartate 1-decarboxylase
MALSRDGLSFLSEALEKLETTFKGMPDFHPNEDIGALTEVLEHVTDKMTDNYPYAHPFYMGQMLKPPHAVARLAYMLSMWVNPNNHALDGGLCSSQMEKEAVAQLAGMFGWSSHLGHLSSGGTFANLEALWVSGVLTERKKILASQQAHYTHQRICGVLNLPFESVPCDRRARMDLKALESILERGGVGTVVVTMGTTGPGSVDPLPEVLELQSHYGFRIHADAAYGGYYFLVKDLTAETRAAFDELPKADSIVIDPHKHGLQPYGCGCVLFRDPSVGRLYKHDSPYTYFSSSDLHLGEISLECSRPGSSAVALWATQRLLPLLPDGEFADGLTKCRRAALKLCNLIEQDSRFLPGLSPDLDIVIWAPKAGTSGEISRLTQVFFDAAATENVHLAMAKFPAILFKDSWKGVEWDQDEVFCLRACVMKPEHLDWMDRIWEVLDGVADKSLK